MAPHSSTLAWKIPWTDKGAWGAAVHGVAKSQEPRDTCPLISLILDS